MLSYACMLFSDFYSNQIGATIDQQPMKQLILTSEYIRVDIDFLEPFGDAIFVDVLQNGEESACDVQAFFVHFVVFTESGKIDRDNLKCALGVCYDLLSTVYSAAVW